MKLYAFWNYDTYPYLLGGPIVKVRDNGYVTTENYGPGYSFWPVRILTLKAGQLHHAKLKKLEAEYKEAQKAFNLEWKRKAELLAKEIGA